jgi:hypothetical protein
VTVSTTYRADARAALFAYLQAFQTAYNATAADKAKIQQTYRARPATMNPPALFVGTWRESISLDMQLVGRQAQVDILLVQGIYDNAETMDRQDGLTDAFISYMANHPYVGVGTNLSLLTLDQEITLSGGSSAVYLGTAVTLSLNIQEGGL